MKYELNPKTIFLCILTATVSIAIMMLLQMIHIDKSENTLYACPSSVPIAALRVALYYNKTGRSPCGFGKPAAFHDDGTLLPRKTKEIAYKRMAIYPKIKGLNRGARRLIVGSDNHFYYTADHYQSVIAISNTCLKMFAKHARDY